MRLQALDLIIIVAYMAGVLLLGWYFSRKQRDLRDYFLSDHDIPWWAIAASIVATETSVVTFISVPAFAFAAAGGVGGNFTFLQLVLGYLLGRLIIVALFIPLYFRGELFTVYQILDRRFGGRVKRAAASLFIATRSLSDGVRIYATAIPLAVVTGWADWKSILAIGVVMIVFTYLGGICSHLGRGHTAFHIHLRRGSRRSDTPRSHTRRAPRSDRGRFGGGEVSGV